MPIPIPIPNPDTRLPFPAPASILIVGCGVFGLGTAYALARRDEFSRCSITVLDRSGEDGLFPARDASSIDSSRIIRADYADPAYAALAAAAQTEWRKSADHELGGQGRYSEAGLVVVADVNPTAAGMPAAGGKRSGADYCRSSWENVRSLAKGDPAMETKILLLPSASAIRDAVGTGGGSGVWGYINKASGWADADASMRFLFGRVQATGRVNFVSGTAASLSREYDRITGVTLTDGRALAADLVVLATGAWTGGLVDLAGRATATAQVLGYLDITDEEQAALSPMPVILNLSSGLFIIPPAKNVLKVARHEYGYLNPTTKATPLFATTGAGKEEMEKDEAEPYTVSLPHRNVEDAFRDIPERSKAILRSALREMIPLPAVHERPFTRTKVCWYTDTKTGDFLIDYHPQWKGLFVATGGNGHAFKFLPVLGERIADCLLGNRPTDFTDKWAWKTSDVFTKWNEVSTEDGSRGGKAGLIFQDELNSTTATTASQES